MSNNKPKLSLKEKNDKNPYESVLEQTGITNTFTVNQVLDHFEFTEKKLIEAKKQIEVNEMQDKLVSDKEFIANLPKTKEERQEIIDYISRQLSTEAYEELVEACNKTLDQYRSYMRKIKDEFEIELPKHIDI